MEIDAAQSFFLIDGSGKKGLTDILTTLDEICKSIKSGIPDIEGVDEQLATANTSSDQQ